MCRQTPVGRHLWAYHGAGGCVWWWEHSGDRVCDKFTAGLGVGPGPHLCPARAILLCVCQLSIYMLLHMKGPPPSHAHPNPFSISLHASEEPAGVVKHPPATDRMCFWRGDKERAGLGLFAGGERLLVARNVLTCRRWD